MKVAVSTEEGAVFSVEVTLDLVLKDLKAILEIETDEKPDQMVLFHNAVCMSEEEKSLREYNVQDGDVIQLTVTHPSTAPQGVHLPNIDWGSIQVPASPHHPSQTAESAHQRADPDDPEEVRRHFLSHPNELAMLRQQNPRLAQALEGEDTELFRQTLQRQVQAVRDVERQRIRMLNADPMDPDVQQRIAQDIQQKNIEENMQAAIEYTPESFSNVVMLYIQIKVNGVPVKAMVDSGAAGTIMSDRCAKECGVMRLVDRRFAGMAVGVGTQKIIGKVHLGTIQIGEDFLTSSFKVLENQTEDMLLGLDMLRRHQCCIDLRKNVLKIGTTGNETPFLTEAELKDKEEMRLQQVRQIMEGEDAEMARAIATSEELNQPLADQPGPSHQSSPPHSERMVIPESAIQQIVSAGFSREDAIRELQRTDGNVEYALTALLAKSITLD